MPKIKTNRSAAKRFTLTGTGKVKRRKQNLRHILTKKSAKRKRKLGKSALVDSANINAVKRLLPNSF
ncbi:MAG: 50S ribosomal protein L35 [Desulfonatronovibrio sp.]